VLETFVIERLFASGLWLWGEISALRRLKVAVNGLPTDLEIRRRFDFATAFLHESDDPFS
jgi:hypothetical protein